MLRLLSKIFRAFGRLFIKISERLLPVDGNASKMIEKGSGRNLYKTTNGDTFWLDPDPKAYVDYCIISTGVFEPFSSKLVRKIVQPGDTVLDIGANIGYYSVMLSRCVGERGKVLSFEPMEYYREILDKNIRQNNISNVEIFPFGFSNKETQYKCIRGDSSATIHFYGKQHDFEIIQCKTLDAFCMEKKLDCVDFIKIDVDGHEPCIMQGGNSFFKKYDPTILLEVAHLYYFKQGTFAWDFYSMLKEQGYNIYDEDGGTPILNLEDFLIKCGNFAYSRNVIISRRAISW